MFAFTSQCLRADKQIERPNTSQSSSNVHSHYWCRRFVYESTKRSSTRTVEPEAISLSRTVEREAIFPFHCSHRRFVYKPTRERGKCSSTCSLEVHWDTLDLRPKRSNIYPTPRSPASTTRWMKSRRSLVI